MIQDTKEPVKLVIDLGNINEDRNDKAEETGKIKKRNKIKTGMTWKRMTEFIVDESVR
jgi:hypothetical protein